jgi:predicted polyphosphate/ATP-dependent NAD kinase
MARGHIGSVPSGAHNRRAGAARSGTVGIIANPLAGKDVRRLVSSASAVSDSSKIGIVRRAIVAALDGEVERVLVAPDCRSVSERAVDGLNDSRIEMIDEITYGLPSDTIVMARHFQAEGTGALIVLGGDGTHRDIAKGWLDAPMVSISTGTNNVFPRYTEATLAGTAAALVATRSVPLDHAARQTSVIHVVFADGESDLALVDIALIDGAFIGSRAVWEPGRLRELVACIAEPASVGLSAIAGLVHPLHRYEPGGVHLTFGAGGAIVRAPIAPGTFVDVPVRLTQVLADGDSVTLTGPGVLSFDGERDRVLVGDEAAMLIIGRTGPMVIDVDRTIEAAARAHHFLRPAPAAAPDPPKEHVVHAG